MGCTERIFSDKALRTLYHSKSDNTHFDLPQAWNLHKAQHWSKSVLTFDRFRPHALIFGYYLFSSYYKFPFNTVSCHYLTKKLKVNFLFAFCQDKYIALRLTGCAKKIKMFKEAGSTSIFRCLCVLFFFFKKKNVLPELTLFSRVKFFH